MIWLDQTIFRHFYSQGFKNLSYANRQKESLVTNSLHCLITCIWYFAICRLKGVDALAGVEAVISHLVVKEFQVPCAHAPALSPTPLCKSLSPKSAAEEVSNTLDFSSRLLLYWILIYWENVFFSDNKRSC